jgi:hypothetical protein
MNPACISVQNEVEHLRHVIVQQKMAIEWLHTSMLKNHGSSTNLCVPQEKQLQNHQEKNKEKLFYNDDAGGFGHSSIGNPSLYSRFESNRILKKEKFGWPSMIEIQIYLENLEIRQSHQTQKNGKKKLLPEIKEFLDQALDVQSDLFGSWCDLYQTSVSHKMATVSKAIIQHLLTWVPFIDPEKALQLESVVLLENLKRSLLRIFHKVKRLNVARKTFA